MAYRFYILLNLSILFCSRSYGQNKDDSLFVFVGKKMSIKKTKQPTLTSDQISFSTQYQLKFEIIQNIHNKFTKKTIVFYAGAHLGLRELPKSDYSLLFLSYNNGQYHLIRFQYFDVYKTKNGHWASFGDPFYADGQYRDSVKTPIAVTALDFQKPITFKINPSLDSSAIKQAFPEPYYKVEGQHATGLMGCYVEDLFIVKKEGILRHLGYFK